MRWPVIGADPAPRRLSHPMRLGYLLVGMPFSSFLGLAIFSASSVLYEHYATLERACNEIQGLRGMRAVPGIDQGRVVCSA